MPPRYARAVLQGLVLYENHVRRPDGPVDPRLRPDTTEVERLAFWRAMAMCRDGVLPEPLSGEGPETVPADGVAVGCDQVGTVGEVAAILHIQPSAVRKRIRAGTLNAHRHGDRWCIPLEGVQP